MAMMSVIRKIIVLIDGAHMTRQMGFLFSTLHQEFTADKDFHGREFSLSLLL